VKKKPPFNTDAARRLRAMAKAIEAGETLMDVAAKFGLDVAFLHRIASPRQRHRYRKITADMLQIAASRVAKGDSYAKVAASLDIRLRALVSAMRKRGLLATKLRPAPVDLSPAIGLYQKGVPIAEIARTIGCSVPTLYSYFRKYSVPLRRGRLRKGKFRPAT
jgi:Putative ATPase subunit of terminase (gpP-like)